MSEGNKKYIWQEIEVSPHNASEIIDQIDFLEKTLEIDSSGLVIHSDERQAMHVELDRLNKMLSVALAETKNQLDEAVRRAERKAVRQADPWFQLRRTCYELRFVIWLLLPGFLIMLLMLPSSNNDLPWMFPTWCVIFMLYLVWAIWGSSLPEE